jgi:hypothetical protein
MLLIGNTKSTEYPFSSNSLTMKFNKLKQLLSLLFFCTYFPLSGCAFSQIPQNNVQASSQLAHNQANNVEIPLPDTRLDFFETQKREKLVQYLSSSAQWHVRPWGAPWKLAAVRRIPEDKFDSSYSTDSLWKPTGILAAGGARLPEGYPDESNILIWLEKPNTTDSPYDSLAASSSQQINLKSYFDVDSTIQPSDRTIYSDLSIKSQREDLQLNIFERSHDRNRAFTRTSLKSVSNELQKLADANDSSVSSLLAKGSVIKSENPKLFIHTMGVPGHLKVSGYINPQEPGLIYLIEESKKRRSEPYPKSLSYLWLKYTNSGSNYNDVEYVGWSNNSLEKFYFCIETRIYRTKTIKIFPVTFEIWFRPSNGGSDRLLIKKTQMIEGKRPNRMPDSVE